VLVGLVCSCLCYVVAIDVYIDAYLFWCVAAVLV